jgi:hypothetical protein
MKRLALSFHAVCIFLACLTTNAFAQIITTESAKPKRGEVELLLRGGGDKNVVQVRNVIARLAPEKRETK